MLYESLCALSIAVSEGRQRLHLPCRNLRQRRWQGHIEVDHETGKLTIRVRMEGAKTAHQDLKTLSGGERSFITICFLLALGRQLLAKFHCLDEFDVFMDSLSQGVRTAQPCFACLQLVSILSVRHVHQLLTGAVCFPICELHLDLCLCYDRRLLANPSVLMELLHTTCLMCHTRCYIRVISVPHYHVLMLCACLAAKHGDVDGVCGPAEGYTDGCAHAPVFVSNRAGQSACSGEAAQQCMALREVYSYQAA